MSRNVYRALSYYDWSTHTWRGHLVECTTCNTYHQTIDEIKSCNNLYDNKHERKEAMSNQPTTIREVNPMKQCKHQVWDWKLIPGQVNTDYKAVYCELCGEQLAQLAPKNKPMTDKQIKFIRSLFLEVKSNMTIDEQESLTTKMKAHIDGTNVLTTKWASAAIDKLKTYKPKPVKPVQVIDKDEPFGMVECHICGFQYLPEEMGGSGTEVGPQGCIACLY
jgi:hypothetical protein